MEIIGKVSKGSKMDQVYLSKNRTGFTVGNYVVIKPIDFLEERKKKKDAVKLCFYGVKNIEPLKLKIIREVLDIIDNASDNHDNIFITGSFLDEGFQFNDIDILIISEDKLGYRTIKEDIKKKIGIKAHILILNGREIAKGMETDPLYQMMLSRCISKKRFIYKTKHIIDYKILDLHLIKSKTLIDNFDVLSGNEKYYLVRNMVAIYIYLKHKKTKKELVDNEIRRIFDLKDIKELKQNLIDKKNFLKKYKQIYDKTFSKILHGIENDAKQK